MSIDKKPLQGILVTGGAGFIGSNFVIQWCTLQDESVINFDKLTYAGNLLNLITLKNNPQHFFVQGDIQDSTLIRHLLETYQPRAIINFAAESHVDRSIHTAKEFIQTNIVGTFTLLEEAKAYWLGLPNDKKTHFRFLHISTDEVYGSLNLKDSAFVETTPYAPNSPYSSSKAASDHLVRAYHHTYGLPTLTTNCSNNYGPYQFPEKLIPLIIANALANKPLPIYGDGQNIRDWLYVEDHCQAIQLVLEKGKTGETYNIGGNCEQTNLAVVETICDLLDEIKPSQHSYKKLIAFVKDRPGHDQRYAVNTHKVKETLGWQPRETFYSGIHKTILWYLSNQVWLKQIVSGEYKNWLDLNYSQRNNFL